MFFKNLQFLDKKWNFDTLCLSSLPSAYIHNTYRNSILVIHQSIFSKDESHTQVEKGTIFIIKSKGSKNNPRICKNEVGFEKFVFHMLLYFKVQRRSGKKKQFTLHFSKRENMSVSAFFHLAYTMECFKMQTFHFWRREGAPQNLFHMPFYTLKFIQKIDLMFE